MKPQIILHPDRPGLEKFMGGLEARVMEIIWANKSLTVKRVHYFLSKKRSYAYTTVMTIMNRLVTKCYLDRKKVSHAYEYTPLMSREEFLDYAVGGTVKSIKSDFAEVFNRVVTAGSKPKKRRHK